MGSKSKKSGFSQASKHLNEFASFMDCFDEIITAYSEYLIIVEQEQTKRAEIKAWELQQLAEIKYKRDFLIGYLEKSFDERAKNFQSMFALVDKALDLGNTEQLALSLHAIVEIAKSNPFGDLADLNKVKASLDDPDHVWEL